MHQLHLAYVLLFFLLGVGIVFAILTLSGMVRPRRPSRDKLTTYECAEVPIGSGWFRLNLRFYTVALIFIIFDVEVIAVVPVALVYKDLVAQHLGPAAFIEIFLFVGILLVGLAYVWRKGDLEWFKRIERPSAVPARRLAPVVARRPLVPARVASHDGPAGTGVPPAGGLEPSL